jgi:V8-like Glu-specific endopeptidase
MNTLSAVVVSFAVLASWPIEKIELSMAKLITGNGQCSAFSIAPGKWVTAAHCLDGGPYTLNKTHIATLTEASFGMYGLAVLTSDLKRPAFKMGDKPKRGEDILQTGYGGGGPLIFYEGVVVIPAITFDGAPLQFTSAPGMPGMSGGPVVNRKGRIVSVVIGAVKPTEVPTLIAYGTRWEDLRDLLRRYQ